jgi:aryl-phospho-beta-D-glucosidase BglC (GH1 family)
MLKRTIAIFTATASLMMLSTAAHAQLPSPAYGWNLGNTMEPPSGIGTWGNPAPNQTLINSVKSHGFNVIRIPCAWVSNSNRSGVINPAYLAAVKQVVDWSRAAGLTVVINNHWDGGWLDDSKFMSYSSSINSKVQTVWTQVANAFSTYDSGLLFACTNEPKADTATKVNNLVKYYQTFVNTVRATGGNNTSRWLIIQGATGGDPEGTLNLLNTLPTDPTPGRLGIEVHWYAPYQYTLMTADANWGNMWYFWGSGYHSLALPNRNATNWEEAYVDQMYSGLKTKFIDKGHPVIVGEFGLIPRNVTDNPDLNTGNEPARALASLTYWVSKVVNRANAYGVAPCVWDTGALFDRTTGAVKDAQSLNGDTGGPPLPPPSGGF